MKINRRVLLDAVSIASRVIDRRAKQGLYRHVRICSDGGDVTVQGFSPTGQVTVTLPRGDDVQVDSDYAEHFIDAASLSAFLSSANGPSVKLSSRSPTRINVRCGNAKTRFALLDGAIAPQPLITTDPRVKVSMVGSDFADLVRVCAPTIGKQYGMTGAHLDQTPTGIRMVTTDDGRQVRKMDRPAIVLGDSGPITLRTLMPPDVMANIAAIVDAEEIKLDFFTSMGRLVAGTILYEFSLIDGEFPDYQQALNGMGGVDTDITLSVSALDSALSIAEIATQGEKKQAVDFQLTVDDGNVFIDLISAGGGAGGMTDSSARIDCQTTATPETFTPYRVQIPMIRSGIKTLSLKGADEITIRRMDGRVGAIILNPDDTPESDLSPFILISPMLTDRRDGASS
ncbi:MAG: hypothetical protein AAFV53_38970 [Myxococcota bacterium]